MPEPVASKFPPKEALDWFKAKGLKPAFDYRDVWKEEHANAFTVAKMLNADLLVEVRALVEQALEQGQTYQQFAAAIKPLLVKSGWWGIQEMDDPATGETQRVQLGSEGRIKTIYRTNMRTARAAGQWQRIERTKVLRIGVISGATPYFHKDLVRNEWQGFGPDFAQSLAAKLGAKVERVETSWGNAVMDLQANKIDVMFGMGPTPARREMIDFSDMLFNNTLTVVCKKGYPEVKTWEQLNDPKVKIVVDVGSNQDQFATKTLPKASISRLESSGAATMAIQTGRADCQVLMVLLAVQREHTLLHEMLRAPALVWVGKLSYGVYLWHYPVVRYLRTDLHWSLTVALGLAISLALAALAFHTVERWALRWRDARPAPHKPPRERSVGSPALSFR